MSKPQTAALQRDIAAILLPGESVTRALQRLGKQDKRPAGVRVCVASACQAAPVVTGRLGCAASDCHVLYDLLPCLVQTYAAERSIMQHTMLTSLCWQCCCMLLLLLQLSAAG